MIRDVGAGLCVDGNRIADNHGTYVSSTNFKTRKK